jgi:hypothetical protein
VNIGRGARAASRGRSMRRESRLLEDRRALELRPVRHRQASRSTTGDDLDLARGFTLDDVTTRMILTWPRRLRRGGLVAFLPVDTDEVLPCDHRVGQLA